MLKENNIIENNILYYNVIPKKQKYYWKRIEYINM